MINARKAKWSTADVLALQALSPLGGEYVAWTSFSLRPASLLTIINEIDYRRPRLILELGSGASTVYIARFLAKYLSESQLISVEHDGEWSRYIRSLLARDGTADVVKVVDVTLSPWQPSGTEAAGSDDSIPFPDRWYDVAAIRSAFDARSVDLLLVDGPPGGKQLARYPAVPMLRSHLSPDAVIMLDDANRPPETEAVRRWGDELGAKFTIYERMSLAVGRLDGGHTLLGS